MKLLLDTHAFLWHANGSPQLSEHAAALLANPANELLLSTATLWEIAIKVGLKKLLLSCPYSEYVATAISGYSLDVLPITVEDCTAFSMLSFPLRDHRDPFDRLIIIHANCHAASVVGADSHFDAYGVTRFW